MTGVTDIDERSELSPGSLAARIEAYLTNVGAADAAREQIRRAYLAGHADCRREIRRQALARLPDGLTPRQLATLRAFAALVDAGISPTHKAIAAAMGVSKPTVHEHLQALRAKRCLRRNGAHKARAYSLAVVVPPALEPERND